MPTTISPQTALIYAMVLTSAVDGDMTDKEMATIGRIVQSLPAFDEYETGKLTQAAGDCAAILQQDEGLDTVLGLIAEALTETLRETAYTLACDIAAADGNVGPEEARILEVIRHKLALDRLTAAAIERAARARFAKP